MKRTLAMVALLVGVACKDEGEALPEKLSIDESLSLASALGGDVGLAVNIDNCSRIEGPANAVADGRVLATIEAPEPLTFASGVRFIINVPASAFDPAVFGVPARVALTVEATCDGERVRTSPYQLTYVPTLRSFPTATGVTRFWPSDVEGEVLSCVGNRLLRHDASATLLSTIELTFPCSIPDLRGNVGERRYLTVASGAMAAIDPGPVLAWTRATPTTTPVLEEDRFVFDAAWTRPDQDLVVQYKHVADGVAHVALVSRETGQNLSPKLPLEHRALGALTRNADGNIAVLTAEKQVVENVYFIELFTPAGVPVRPPIEASRYPVGTPYAEFSYEGDRLYVTADDGLQNRWIQSVTVTDGVVKQLTQPADGFRFVVGEAYFRVLVASDDGFAWVDRDSGGLASQKFAPDSGNQAYRLRVEPDGSMVMLADQLSAASAAGFYVFNPDGSDLIRLHGEDQQYGWLTESWTGGSLVGVVDAAAAEVQVIPTRAEYEALAD